ncbi:DUF6221 family protein [Streptomyces sp. NPDC045251]|uniref:DUF6221 family protein n=1 Tax=unclassified Streptomyces TaxID=2593676 RepID=UPI0033C6E4E7
MTDDLVHWLRGQLDEDERVARAASGATVVGEPGAWQASPRGDEWEASRTDCDEDELLVALRPGLPRPPVVTSGLWGAVTTFRPEFEDPEDASPLPAFEHAARHDPTRVLREIDAKRQLLGAYTDLDKATDAVEPDAYDVGRLDALEQAVQYAALPYAGRPGYREEWRP